ncbi:hypothetical protein AB9E06_33685 [Rhizobium leguminosarum]|uniref:hypothetical protein n=1 Tax=Rhizobium leguminosarum TaxID=384 RepID=UPI003F94BC0F
MSRENFSDATRLILGQRAAYRCSAPHCGKLTIGPGLKIDQVENTGQAAHIFSAAPNGPRGQGDLSPEDLRDPSNGVWLCGHHSDLIDKNSGLRYAPTIVRSWKALHEFKTAYEHSGRTSTFGFVRKLQVHESPLFEPETTIELGKTTFFIGLNASGKTALCQWFSAVESPRHLWRWIEPHKLSYTLTFDAPVEHQLSIETGDDALTILLDRAEVVANHHRIAVVFLENKGERIYRDDLDLFSDVLNLDPVSTRSLARFVGGISFLEAAEFVAEEDENGELKNKLYCRLANRGRLSYGALSGGERSRVLLEFAISQARSVAKVAPALLIVEWDGLTIDRAGFEFYTTLLSGSDSPFQSIITRYETTPLIEGLGWQTYRLDRTPGEIGKVLPILQSDETASA